MKQRVFLIFVFLLGGGLIGLFAAPESAAESVPEPSDTALSTLEKPLYTPFIERYVLDELKSLRQDLASQKHELMQQILDREHTSVDRAVTYATDTVTYFFYLIAGVSSILVIMGWSSMRDVQKRIKAAAGERMSNLIQDYEARLDKLEDAVKNKTRHIEENRDEIERTQEVQGLWLRAAQETNPMQKIEIYDEILKADTHDIEALTYKADAVLELGEPQWAINLSNQALEIDPGHCHALYQLACAYAALDMDEDAIACIARVMKQSESYRKNLLEDEAFARLRETPAFLACLGGAADDA